MSLLNIKNIQNTMIRKHIVVIKNCPAPYPNPIAIDKNK